MQNITYFLELVFLFLIAPFYFQPNVGGAGLALPYNIPIWAVSSWLIAAGVIFGIKKMRFQYPQLWGYFIAFPLIVLINSLLVEVNQPVTWLFRQLYILGGLFFLFSLFQFQPKQTILDRTLFVIVIAVGLHALLGVMQIVMPNYLPSYFPLNNDLVPRGMFQQINVQASFLTTGLIISLYLVSRPSFRFTNFVVKSVVVIAFTLAVYVVIASGSRIALLSFILATPLIVWSRFRQLRRHKTLLVLLLITSCGSVILGQAGLHKTLDKTAKLTEKSYSTSRVAMYTIGMEFTGF